MKIYTQTYDLAKASPHRFWVAPFSEFKIGIKILEKDEISAKDFTLKAGSTEFTPDADKIDNFTLFTIKSNDTGFVEYTIEVEGVAEKLKLMQIVTDSTVFEIDAGGGDVPADVATQTWVNSQISDFITEEALDGYATESYVDSAISDFITDDALTAYYTKSETSSAIELADAFANVGGGAISAYDMSESPIQSKTLLEQAIQNNTCLPQTVYTLQDDSIHIVDKVGTLQATDIVSGGSSNKVKKIVIGTNISAIDGITTGSTALEELVIPNTVVRSGNNAWIGLGGHGSSSAVLRIPDSLSACHSVSFETSTFAYMDFGNTRTTIPSLNSTYVQNNTKIYVPDSLYDNWTTANKWSTISAYIHYHSELEAPYATSTAVSALTAANSKVTGGAETGTTGTPAAVNVVKSVYETDWSTLSATADANTFYVVVPDPE